MAQMIQRPDQVVVMVVLKQHHGVDVEQGEGEEELHVQGEEQRVGNKARTVCRSTLKYVVISLFHAQHLLLLEDPILLGIPHHPEPDH